MMNKTKIEWVKNPDGSQGYTFNPITGCLNSCPYCYARKLANGRLLKRYLANDNLAPDPTIRHIDYRVADPFYPRFWPEKLYEVTEARKGDKGVFCCNMSDLFGIGIPEEWTRKILNAIRMGPENNRYYLLTKQPQNLARFSPFPDNCWVGVSATDNDMCEEAMYGLYDIDAKVKYISFEPLLGKITDLSPHRYCGEYLNQFIDWAIIGAQTKPYNPPKKIWVDEIIEASKKAGIPYFLKDNLKPIIGGNLVQDMPK